MAYKRRDALEYNPISDTDSYKVSHYYPGAAGMQAYLEARGGEFDVCTLAGAQVLVHTYLAETIREGHVSEMEADMLQHGEPFDPDMWRHIIRVHGGKVPIVVRAIPEGTVVPISTPMLTVECRDPVCFPIVGWFEDKIERLWYPSTVAIGSRESRKIRWKHLVVSSDDPMRDLDFGLHDFGARGVTCVEQARLGGMGHLMSGFLGTDTIESLRLARHYYDVPMAGFSIPATEHSMMTSRGREGELDVLEDWILKQLVNRQLPPGVPKLAACVIDSYDAFAFVKAVTTSRFLPLLQQCGGTLVLRPDSGNPFEVIPKILEILEERLPDGSVTVNRLGFKVLPSYLRLIQGDGITRKTFDAIMGHLVSLGWSITNIVFGSGGGLLQQVNRDTQKWAYKTCALLVNGTWIGVSKDPATDPGKRSKEGRLDTIRLPDGKIGWVVLKDDQLSHPDSIMNVIFAHGDILYHTTFDECRARMDFEKSL